MGSRSPRAHWAWVARRTQNGIYIVLSIFLGGGRGGAVDLFQIYWRRSGLQNLPRHVAVPRTADG
jgi:hypothetical protein